jgi:pilus assembly protein CpaC
MVLAKTMVAFLVLFCGTALGEAAENEQLLDSAMLAQIASSMPQQVAMASADTEGRLRVQMGKSLVVNSPEVLKRVSITDPEIASAVIISPQQVLIHGLLPGSVTLLLWNENDEARSFDLEVQLDVPGLRGTIERILPEEKITVRQSGSSVVLTGSVSSEEIAEQAELLAQTKSENVVNLLEVVELTDVVLLQVKIAEVDRTLGKELGVSLLSTGAANTPGLISAQQNQDIAGSIGAVPSDVERGKDPQGKNVVAGGIGNPLKGIPTAFGVSDLLNIFLFRPDLNLGVAIKALEQQNVLQILAEPNVLAMNGREASFLAGGEFPFPVVQGGSNFTAVTIEFREFGIRVNFTPEVLPGDRIRLKVSPEVSALDFSNALTISGFLVPALSTRKADTEVELHNGQSFAIAGLIDNRFLESIAKIPVLGDIPFLGHLFKSRELSQNNTELLVMVTPSLVEGVDPDQVPVPAFPKPFLDPDKFDGKSGEATTSQPSQ